MELDRDIGFVVSLMVLMIFTSEAIHAYYRKKRQLDKVKNHHAKLIRIQWGKRKE